MSMEMNRRTFLKTTAAAAVAVSMTGLLGGCGDSSIGTDFGGFQAAVVGWYIKPDDPGYGNNTKKWTADFQVHLRLKNTTGSSWNLNAPYNFSLSVDGTLLEMQGGGILSDNRMVYFGKSDYRDGVMHFLIPEEKRDLYEKSIKNNSALIKFKISSPQATETYTAEYQNFTFVKDTTT